LLTYNPSPKEETRDAHWHGGGTSILFKRMEQTMYGLIHEDGDDDDNGKR
jgi:hypothetical protein